MAEVTCEANCMYSMYGVCGKKDVKMEVIKADDGIGEEVDFIVCNSYALIIEDKE